MSFALRASVRDRGKKPACAARDGTPARQSRPEADPCAAPEHPVADKMERAVRQPASAFAACAWLSVPE